MELPAGLTTRPLQSLPLRCLGAPKLQVKYPSLLRPETSVSSRTQDVLPCYKSLPRAKSYAGAGFAPRASLLSSAQRAEVLETAEGETAGPLPGRKSYHIQTFGCQMNMADSERMEGILDAMGLSAVDNPDHADVLLYSALGRQRARRQASPEMRIVVAGCVAQQEGQALLQRVPEVDLIMGPQHANRLAELLSFVSMSQRTDQMMVNRWFPHPTAHLWVGRSMAEFAPKSLEQVDEGSQVIATEPVHILEDITKPRRSSKVTAWVNVIYGCNERCTYCVVPNTRGVEQSRLPEAIRSEMVELGKSGYKEVTLLGQNVDAYGRDLPGTADDGSGRRKWTLTDLLHHVHDVPGIERIRFATSHPRYFTERLIKACAELPKVCKFFHVPFQSGDDEVLRNMARGYTARRYMEIISTIRSYMPDAAISADVIVGFPEVKFDQVNTAMYSPRPNTPSATWGDQVAELAKVDRLQQSNELVLEHCLERNQRYLGRVENLLVEGRNEKPGHAHQVVGRTDSNRLTFFDGPENLIGSIVPVRITEVRAVSLTGELVT